MNNEGCGSASAFVSGNPIVARIVNRAGPDYSRNGRCCYAGDAQPPPVSGSSPNHLGSTFPTVQGVQRND